MVTGRTQAIIEAVLTAQALRKMGWEVDRSENELLVESRCGPTLVPSEIQATLNGLRDDGTIRNYILEVGSLHFAAVVKLPH